MKAYACLCNLGYIEVAERNFFIFLYLYRIVKLAKLLLSCGKFLPLGNTGEKLLGAGFNIYNGQIRFKGRGTPVGVGVKGKSSGIFLLHQKLVEKVHMFKTVLLCCACRTHISTRIKPHLNVVVKLFKKLALYPAVVFPTIPYISSVFFVMLFVFIRICSVSGNALIADVLTVLVPTCVGYVGGIGRSNGITLCAVVINKRSNRINNVVTLAPLFVKGFGHSEHILVALIMCPNRLIPPKAKEVIPLSCGNNTVYCPFHAVKVVFYCSTVGMEGACTYPELAVVFFGKLHHLLKVFVSPYEKLINVARSNNVLRLLKSIGGGVNSVSCVVISPAWKNTHIKAELALFLACSFGVYRKRERQHCYYHCYG